MASAEKVRILSALQEYQTANRGDPRIMHLQTLYPPMGSAHTRATTRNLPTLRKFLLGHRPAPQTKATARAN